MSEQQIPKGYKHTEVGVIPEKWATATIGELFNVNAGGDFDPQRSSVRQSSAYPFPIYANGLENRGLYGFMSSAQCEAGAITVTARGTLGVAFYRDTPFTPIGRLLVLQPRITLDGRYFCEYLNTFVHFAVESTGVPQLTAPQIARYWLPLPPLAEQRAIADALSDVDGLLAALDKLIAKKRAIKKAAMQKLLTGKTRLPGFSGEWEVRHLGKIANLYQPLTISAKMFRNMGFPVYGANGVIGYYDRFNHITWQVAVTCRGSTCGTVNRTVDKCWITGNAMVLNVDSNTEVDKEFFYYLMMAQDLSRCITGTGQTQIIRSSLASLEVCFPFDKAEQRAIATVLSDMDAEIEALERRREKIQQVKQGMMQQLLTGRVRLVKEHWRHTGKNMETKHAH